MESDSELYDNIVCMYNVSIFMYFTGVAVLQISCPAYSSSICIGMKKQQ